MTISIPPRFHGPPDSGNGGYTCGAFATTLGREYGWRGPVEVTLRKPPPLDVAMGVAVSGQTAELRWRDHVIATATPAALTSEPDPVVSFAEALDAAPGYDGFREHPFPSCFVCGPGRSRDDGLVLLAGPVADGVVAAAWEVAPWAAAPEFCWAALDCPTGWAIGLVGRPAVLGRMTTEVVRTPEPGERCVVVGRRVSREGRKAFARGTLWGADGDVIARTATTWIEVDPTQIRPPS